VDRVNFEFRFRSWRNYQLRRNYHLISKRANGPKKGKRANEIECPEKGKGKAPDLKSEARFNSFSQVMKLNVQRIQVVYSPESKVLWNRTWRCSISWPCAAIWCQSFIPVTQIQPGLTPPRRRRHSSFAFLVRAASRATWQIQKTWWSLAVLVKIILIEPLVHYGL
jgi:hypothetical protein